MHQKTKAEIYRALKTRDRGLTAQEAKTRLGKYGENAIEAKGKTPWWKSLLEEFSDLMVLILIFAAVIAGAAGEMADAGVILFIVLLNAMIGFAQKFKAEKALEALQNMLSPTAKVIRGGKIIRIEARLLVPGDIIVISEGDSIPADCRLIQANELQINESALTGESVPVTKHADVLKTTKSNFNEHQNMVFMGTAATHGTGKAVVVNTGMKTEFGTIANLTQTTQKDKSPLQKELGKIGVFVGKVTLVIASILIVVSVLIQGKSFVESFLFATSVAVAAVPEGLPATITIALAIGVQRLAKKKSIVKKLSSVETLGSTSVICSDKTGTLTKNEMTVVKAYVNGELVDITGTGYKPQGKWSMKPSYELKMLCRAALLCNNAKLGKHRGKWDILGDPTEGALIVAASKVPGVKSLVAGFKRVHELPFDSVRKMMTTIDQFKKEKDNFAHLKGAPDEVLKTCTHILENGKEKRLTPTHKKELLKINEGMANKALRVLAFAYRDVDETTKSHGNKIYSKALVEKKMVFLGFMGMIDPPRPEVYDAVEKAHTAGIKIYVITGDYGATAKAIAKNLGIVSGTKIKVITGKTLQRMKERELAKILKDKSAQIIFARVSPEHKLRIVRALKKNGEIVAMTGDGVNDAPALKRADIGVAMGITGTDVSKEAADMILTDDSFGSIVSAIEEGRTIYNNLKKFVFYIFSCNIAELATIFVALILGIPAPLTAILILAIDLGTDVLPAIALGVDPAEPGLMEKPPRSPKKHIMTRKFVSHFVGLGAIMGAIVISMYFWMLGEYGWTWGTELADDSLTYLKASTAAFTMLVLIQMVNAFNARSMTQSIFKLGVFSNRQLLGAVSISLVTLYAFVELPFFQKFLHTTNLTGREWGILAAACFSVLVVEEIRKGFTRMVKA